MRKIYKPRRRRMGKRAYHIDYTRRGIFHIIINKAEGAPRFGEIKGNPHIPVGEIGCAICEQNSLGGIIDREIRNINDYHPLLKTIEAQVMPDHVHFLIFITATISRHLGKELAALEVRINNKYSELNPGAGKVKIFEKGYADVAIRREGQLEIEKRYIKQNPQRYQIMRKYPDFFERDILIRIGSQFFIGFGNAFLLTRSFLFQVMVRSRWSNQEFQEYKKKCLKNCAEGGVAVSPFYSPREKEIYRTIIEMGGSIIIISMESFGPRSKPMGHKFDLCAEGRLLFIYEPEAPEYEPRLKRDIAMRMNSYAQKFVEAKGIRPVFKPKWR